MNRISNNEQISGLLSYFHEEVLSGHSRARSMRARVRAVLEVGKEIPCSHERINFYRRALDPIMSSGEMPEPYNKRIKHLLKSGV